MHTSLEEPIKNVMKNIASFTYYPLNDMTIPQTVFSNELITVLALPPGGCMFQKTTCIDLRCLKNNIQVNEVLAKAYIKDYCINCTKEGKILVLKFVLKQKIYYQLPCSSKMYYCTSYIPLMCKIPVTSTCISQIVIQPVVGDYYCCPQFHLHTTIDFSISFNQ